MDPAAEWQQTLQRHRRSQIEKLRAINRKEISVTERTALNGQHAEIGGRVAEDLNKSKNRHRDGPKMDFAQGNTVLSNVAMSRYLMQGNDKLGRVTCNSAQPLTMKP